MSYLIALTEKVRQNHATRSLFLFEHGHMRYPPRGMPNPAPLRILFLATEWGSGYGGVSTLNRELASAVARVHDVEVYCALPRKPSESDGEGAKRAGVKILHAAECPGEEDNESFLLITPMRDPVSPSTSGAAGHEPLDELGFHAVVGHGRKTGAAAVQIAHRHRIPVRVHIVHVDPSRIEQHKPVTAGRTGTSGARADARSLIELRLAERANLVFGVGPRLTAPLCNAHGLDAHELVPGLSASALPTGGEPRNALLIARLDDRDIKGLDIALDALHELATSNHVELELRGAIDEEETKRDVEKHLRRLRKKNDHQGLRWHVRPFTSDPAHLHASYARAQVVLMPSKEEGFGLVALEAISRGRPVVVSNTSGFAKLVQRVTAHGHEELYRAFIFDSARPDTLAQLVGEIFGDADGARRRAAKLRALLETECDWDRTAVSFVELIRARLAPTHSPGRPGAETVRPPDSVPHTAVAMLPPSGLEAWPRHIGSTWVDRPEEEELRTALAKDDAGPILLVGPPGCGKSALLGKLTADLRAEGRTVVAIKADQIPTNVRTEADLCSWLGIGGTKLAAYLSELASSDQRVVLVLDQLDALASLVDLHTARLSILLGIVRTCADVPAVRIIASMRGLESSYDLQLRELRERRTGGAKPAEIALHYFPPDAVAATWEREVGEPLDSVPAHLLEPRILKLAVHLRQPCVSAAEVTEKFWDRCVVNAPAEAREALDAVIARMDELESFWVEADPNVRARLDHWLANTPLLASTNERPSRYGFAHQTLHEEARARRWLDAHDGGEADALVQWAEQHLHTLTYRPKLRAILQRLRTVRAALHAEVFTRLWDVAAERVNLRELLAVHLAQAEGPSAWETRQMEALLSGSEMWLRYAALAVLRGRERWFRALTPWLETRVDTDDARWLVGYLSGAWAFAEDILDRWTSRWITVAERRRLALIAFMERRDWTDDGFTQLLTLATPAADEDLVGAILHASLKSDPKRQAIAAAHYAAAHWDRAFGSEDPYDAPEGYYWREVANADPVTFVDELAPAVARGAVRAVASATEPRSRFATDHHASRHLDWSFQNHPLAVFADALREAAVRTAGTCAGLRTLDSVDNDAIQGVLLRAYGAIADTSPALVARFLLADVRRLQPEEEALPAVLRKLAPHLDSVCRGELLAAAARILRYSGLPDMDETEGVRTANREYRELLRSLIMGVELEAAQRELVDDIERPTRGGFVRSPLSSDDLTRMDYSEFEAALTYYADHDETDFFSGPEPVGGNGPLCQELERWAEREPVLAAERLDALLTVAPARPDLRDATVRLLYALAKHEGVDVQNGGALLERGIGVGVFQGVDDDGRDARWMAASAIRSLIVKGWGPGRVTIDSLTAWVRGDASHGDDPAEALEDDKALFPHPPRTSILPRGSYPFLDALCLAMLLHDEAAGGWQTLLQLLDELLAAADARSWRVLLASPGGLRPDRDHETRWLAWLDRLFEVHPAVLAHPEGVSVIWNQRWIAQPEQMRRWLAQLRGSEWPSGPRAADELATLMLAIDPHTEWARAELDEKLSTLADGATAIGVVHALGALWSEETVHSIAEPWIERLIEVAPPERLATMLTAVRQAAFRPSDTLFRILRRLAERGIRWPRSKAYQLAEGVLDAVHQHPLEAATAAHRLLDDLDGNAAVAQVEEPLTLLALHLTRQEDEALRRRGMDLFERVLVSEGWYLRRAMREIDEIAHR